MVIQEVIWGKRKQGQNMKAFYRVTNQKDQFLDWNTGIKLGNWGLPGNNREIKFLYMRQKIAAFFFITLSYKILLNASSATLLMNTELRLTS